MKSEMLKFESEVNALLATGADLRVIMKWSYVQRELRGTPYLAVLDAGEQGPEVLQASPTKAQKELTAFFSEKAPCSVLPRFTFRVTLNGVEFLERVSRGPLETSSKRVV